MITDKKRIALSLQVPLDAPGRAKVVCLIVLLLSAGLTAPVGGAIQHSEFGREVAQLYLPRSLGSGTQTGGGGGGSFFFSFVGGDQGDGNSLVPPQDQKSSQTLAPLGAVDDDYYFIREGDGYFVFLQSTSENGGGGSPVAVTVFTPLFSAWLDSERRRSRFRIYVEILDILRRGPMTPYELSFHLRLNSKRTRDYVEFLAKKQFLDCSEQDGKIFCTITQSGKTLVENMRMILESDKGQRI
jgi:predicted transcriptional regulator